MTTRAKFRCHSIKLQRTSFLKEGLRYEVDSVTRPARPFLDEHGNSYSIEEAYVPWDQPTVELYAVTSGSEENKAFFAATPSARIELTISNPDAAETFELGKEYYVDFSPAS